LRHILNSATQKNASNMSSFSSQLHALRGGLLFSLLTLVFGFGMGVAFGVGEDAMKANLKERALAVLQERYEGNTEKAEAVATKAWNYYKRAHLHANGLGTTSLALILLLAFTSAGLRWRQAAAWAGGIGGLGYSVFWLWAGYLAPALGSTGAAKEALNWLAMPSVMACTLALLYTLWALLSWKKPAA
jgi:hypothetical protein